jgi:hypothetical protein
MQIPGWCEGISPVAIQRKRVFTLFLKHDIFLVYYSLEGKWAIAQHTTQYKGYLFAFKTREKLFNFS